MSNRWEIFFDESYYFLWCVREIGNTDFNSQRSFHFVVKEDADLFKNAVEKEFVGNLTKEN